MAATGNMDRLHVSIDVHRHHEPDPNGGFALSAALAHRGRENRRQAGCEGRFMEGNWGFWRQSVFIVCFLSFVGFESAEIGLRAPKRLTSYSPKPLTMPTAKTCLTSG